ncbi:YCF48-related protein [Seonamhaeicola sp. ML3]|uniref:YCF48-related protein n=1 Tax=Seonamhaeicola sp. ML3 TaxID=2937786 RepID=UPI00200DE255|nr:YCF48-related protein [Seonamhaeicola sp. ML3]
MKDKILLFLAILSSIYLVHSQNFIKDFYSITDFTSSNNQVFFVANDVTHGDEIWVSDGTKQGTHIVKDIFTGPFSSSPKNLFVFKNELYFSANNGFTGNELWKTDGTQAGTSLVKNIYEKLRASSSINSFTIFNDELFFLASNNRGNSTQIWKTNGTAEGTLMVYDANTQIKNLIVANDKMYFVASNKLWEFENSNNVNQLNIDEYYFIDELNSFNNELYFITNTSSRQSIRFYRRDVSGNNIMLKEFNQPQYGDIDIHNFTQVGSLVYFSITTDFNSDNDTDVLWKTDGTPSGTVPVKSFYWDRHWSKSNISDFIDFNGNLYFNGGRQNESKLWKSDGSEQGTIQALNISESGLTNLMKLEGLLYFFSNEKLWIFNGSDSNPQEFSEFMVTSKESQDLFNAEKGLGKIFYEGVKGDKKGLYTSDLKPVLEVKYDNYSVGNNKKIYLEAKKDSVLRTTVKLKNSGNSNLFFTKISISGKDYYLDGVQDNNINIENPGGNFQQVLSPNEESEFEILFFPSSLETKSSQLEILSNDVFSSIFNLEFLGSVEEEAIPLLEEDVVLSKEILFTNESYSIVLDKNTIVENQSINEIIGNLRVEGSILSYNFELVPGEGDTNNKDFKIEDNKVVANAIFDYETANSFSIRIRATNNESSEVVENQVFISVLNETENKPLVSCRAEVFSMPIGFLDVEFINDDTAIAVGTHGVILKSSDKGKNWKIIRRESVNRPIYYSNVQFITSEIGYVTGYKDLLKTEDGGVTWFSLSLPDESYPFPNNLLFLNEEVGFVFGEDGKIFKTKDGGVFWEKQVLSFDDISDAHFFDDLNGIISLDETLWQTNDGGETWTERSLGVDGLRYSFKITNIEFISTEIGFLTGNRGEIIKTEDGGDTWNLISTIETNYSLNDILFIDTNHGYVTANGIYETVDGGVNWTRLQSSIPLENYNSIKKNNNGDLIVVGMVDYGALFDKGGIIKTKEANGNWELISSFNGGNYTKHDFYFKGDIGYVFGENESKKTIDGGITWQNFSIPDITVKQFEVVDNSMFLFGINTQYQNVLFKSIDNGTTWQNITNLEYVNNIYFVNDLIMFTTKETGIFKSVDGGVNWKNVDTSHNPYDLFIINESKLFAAGVFGVIKTEDGGETWESADLELENGNSFVYSISFFDDKIGLAGSNDGIIYKTTNGGETWEKIYTLIHRNVKHIHAISEEEWFATGDGYFLYKSYDAGNTWNIISSSSNDLKIVHKDNNTFYGLGNGSFIKLDFKDIRGIIPSKVSGNEYPNSKNKERYKVLNESGVHYKWSVSGDNEINYNNESAEVFWKTPGNYTLSVTAYNECSQGKTRTINVIVEDVEESPVIIEGNTEVSEYSLNNSYTTILESNYSYNWFLQGHQSASANNNNIKIDWDKSGNGIVKVIKTNTVTGQRRTGNLDITISPIAVSHNNFTIQAVGETCPDTNNAKILISALENHNYTVTINGQDYEFSSDLVIENLTPDSYDFCVEILDSSFSQCFSVNLAESTTISGKTSNDRKGKVSVNIQEGTAPYSVYRNGKEVLKTSSKSFEVVASHGDLIDVTTSKSCEGKLSNRIDTINNIVAYPNPTSGRFEIALPILDEEIKLEVFTIQSQLISSSIYKANNGKIELDFQEQPNGVYFLKVNLKKPITVKIIKN